MSCSTVHTALQHYSASSREECEQHHISTMALRPANMQAGTPASGRKASRKAGRQTVDRHSQQTGRQADSNIAVMCCIYQGYNQLQSSVSLIQRRTSTGTTSRYRNIYSYSYRIDRSSANISAPTTAALSTRGSNSHVSRNGLWLSAMIDADIRAQLQYLKNSGNHDHQYISTTFQNMQMPVYCLGK